MEVEPQMEVKASFVVDGHMKESGYYQALAGRLQEVKAARRANKLKGFAVRRLRFDPIAKAVHRERP
jgi:hypothetical protein